MSYDFGLSQKVSECDTSGDVFFGGLWEFEPLCRAMSTLGTKCEDDVWQIDVSAFAGYREAYAELMAIPEMNTYRTLCGVDFSLAHEYFASLPVSVRAEAACAFRKENLGDAGVVLWEFFSDEHPSFVFEILESCANVEKLGVDKLYLWQSY